MNLEEVLESPEIELHEIEKEEYNIPEVIDSARHQEIIAIAEKEGMFNSMKRKGNGYQRKLKAKVDKYLSSKRARKDPTYLYYLLELFEETKDDAYIANVRKGIKEALCYVPTVKEIGKEIGETRMRNITSKLLDDSDEEDVKKTRGKALKSPKKREIEEARKSLYESRLRDVIELSAELYKKTRSEEDLARAVHVHNTLVEWSDKDFPDLTIEQNLVSLLTLTKKNAIREEYRNRMLKEAEEDFYVGSSFDRMVDLFFMTRLPEDKELADKLMERGIELIKEGKSTNFGNFTGKFFELYEFTKDLSYLEKFRSMAVQVDEEEWHPHFMGTGSTAIPIFLATEDRKYIPEIKSYCEVMEKKGNFKTAHGIYFTLFEKTKEKVYLTKAREMLKRVRNNGSAERPILSPKKVFDAINEVVSAMNETRNMVLEDMGDSWKKEEADQIFMGEEFVRELEDTVRTSSETNMLMRYLKNHVEYPEDIDTVRRNLTTLFNMKHGPHVDFFNNLFDLYQVTGSVEDLDEIRKRVREYSSKRSEAIWQSDLLKAVYRSKDYRKKAEDFLVEE